MSGWFVRGRTGEGPAGRAASCGFQLRDGPGYGPELDRPARPPMIEAGDGRGSRFRLPSRTRECRTGPGHPRGGGPATAIAPPPSTPRREHHADLAESCSRPAPGRGRGRAGLLGRWIAMSYANHACPPGIFKRLTCERGSARGRVSAGTNSSQTSRRGGGREYLALGQAAGGRAWDSHLLESSTRANARRSRCAPQPGRFAWFHLRDLEA